MSDLRLTFAIGDPEGFDINCINRELRCHQL